MAISSIFQTDLSYPERLEVEVVGLRTYQQRTEADIYTLKRNSEVLVHTASKIA